LSVLVDVEVWDPSGTQQLGYQFWDNQGFSAGQTKTYPFSWSVPATAGTYSVQIGIFAPGDWATEYTWNSHAGQFAVATPTTASTPVSTTPTATPVTTAPTATKVPPTATPVSGSAPTTTLAYPFTYTLSATLPVSSLPSDADCANTIIAHRSNPDPDAPAYQRNDTNSLDNSRSPLRGYTLQNGTYVAPYQLHNNSFFTEVANLWGFPARPDVEAKITGDFTGTTDEIIQWAACKWGLDVNVVRAQVVMESDYFQGILGDCSAGQAAYSEITPCQTFGIIGLRAGDTSANSAYRGAWPYGLDSTAFNLDYSLAVRRLCFMGGETYLGNGYAAGDLWGCVGEWFSGNWHDAAADQYMNTVKTHYASKDWKNESPAQQCDQMNEWRRCLYR
jgi:autotransporter family porin